MEDFVKMEVVHWPEASRDEAFQASSLEVEQGNLAPTGGDYFFWLASQDQEDVFPLFDPEIRALSPVPPVPQASPLPVLGEEDITDFDPDAFLDTFLCSPEGKAILEDPSPAPPVLEDCLEEFLTLAAPAMAVDAVPIKSEWEFLVDTPAELPPAAPSSSGTSPFHDAMEESDGSDVSVSDEDDPAWLPPGAPSSDEEEQRPSFPSKPSRKGMPLGPRQPRTKEERKERKKGQNRNAASRYREKKRLEKERIGRELGELRADNIRLQTRVKTMREDIQYFQKLMITVLQAKVGDRK